MATDTKEVKAIAVLYACLPLKCVAYSIKFAADPTEKH